MVVVGKKSEVLRTEMLSFGEPRDYIPSGKWYAQFESRVLDEDLSLKRKIRNVTGCTLTARATTDCVRRSLALHQVIEERAKAEREKEERAKKEREKAKKKAGSGTDSK